MNLTKEEKTVRNILINVASKKQLIYYSDLCKTANLRLDMSIPADRGKIGEMDVHLYLQLLFLEAWNKVTVSLN